MLNIHLQAKGHGIGQKKLDAAQLEAGKRIIAEVLKQSTGAMGKLYELVVRFLLYKDGLKLSDFRARPAGELDFTLTIDGKRIRGQIKTGDGIVTGRMAPSDELEVSEADIMPGCDVIVYCTEPSKLDSVDAVLDNSVVVSREEFLSVVLTAGQKRRPNWRSGIKRDTNNSGLREQNRAHKGEPGYKPVRDCCTMQPSYRSARWELCQSGELTSLRTFLQDIGRL